MYIPTTLYELSFILHVESLAKTVIKGTISQLSPIIAITRQLLLADNSKSLSESANILTPSFLRKYILLSCTSAYTTCW